MRGRSVETAHCTCLAGLGESSSSHIGTLLFKLEAAVRQVLQKKPVLMLLAHGIKTLLKKVKPDKIDNITIYSQKAIYNSKKREPKTISFSGTNAKPKL